jgi:flagellar hook-associated protein 1 FlgK
MITSLASDAASTRLQLVSQEQVVQALESRLESIRGVSLDEEAANMARFQNAYTASAKVVVAAQDMFDTILQML